MKFLSKTICVLLFSTSLHARDIILLENLATPAEGEMVMSILQKKFNLPRKFITYKKAQTACKKNSEAIMQLCLRSNGELDIVKMNKFVVEETLGVFLELED